MTLRFIVRTVDATAMCNVGGPLETRFATMDLYVPNGDESERFSGLGPWLRKHGVCAEPAALIRGEVIGIEVRS